jgi:ABC-type glycerol-3-phosphate transport system substrate-binding protein
MDLGRTGNATANIMQLCWGFGGRTYDPAGNPAFDHEGNVRGFALIDEMYNKHGIIPKAAVGNRDDAWNNKAYQSGQVAFIANPTSVYAYLSTDDPELMAKTGLFALPAGPAGSINQIDTWSLALLAQSPYPELAKGLAEYFMAPERYHEVIVANNGRFVPVYPDLLNDSWWSERPESAAFIEIASTGAPISYEAPPSAASGEVLATHVIPEALQEVLLDRVDPAEAVARAHQKIAAISERYAKHGG